MTSRNFPAYAFASELRSIRKWAWPNSFAEAYNQIIKILKARLSVQDVRYLAVGLNSLDNLKISHGFIGVYNLRLLQYHFFRKNLSSSSSNEESISPPYLPSMNGDVLLGSIPSFCFNSLTGSERIYALMQCIPGLSSKQCEICVRDSLRDYQNCCNGFMGGTIRKPVCYFLWDGYAYFGAFNDTPSAPTQESQPGPILSPPTPPPLTTGAIVGIVVSTVIFVVLVILGLFIWKKKQSYKTLKPQSDDHTDVTAADDDMTSPQSLQFDFGTIEAATDGFSRNNKLGQGGFGEVYKGTLLDGTEVAVKRLLRNSGQGTQEFKNEVVIVAKLQHKNLVRLLGFCVEGDEQILVYEFKSQLDWKSRYNIIGGITRGLLYLHQDSRLTIIHRDIKASNILLDEHINPKIADFGMARNFRVDQTEDMTGRVVGTFSYMPPEYVTHGQYSTKSDVYSFGVLVLEIVCGKKNSSFYQVDDSGGNLVTHAWRLWNNESPLDTIDPAIGESYEKDEVIRCIHIGLLCVQESPADGRSTRNVYNLSNAYQ
ncbi:hypothetical protein Bca101_031250 [Brassica carinata]